MNFNQLWGDLIIEELVRLGTQCFCISPGSRSTPLTLAVAKNPRAKSIVFFDERASSYFALGHTRGSGIPAVLICTSGTAAANYLPAVIESSIEQIPMLVLTADRPPELRDTGANQSINQTHIFGRYTRWFFDPGCPNQDFKLEALLSMIDHAIFKTVRPLPGPVHINLQFREPFFSDIDSKEIQKIKNNISKKIYVKYSTSENFLPKTDIKNLLKNRPQSGILSIGRVPRDSLVLIRELASKLGWPVFADITSGLRLGKNCPNRVTYYDQLLVKNMLSPSKCKVDAIWHIGSPPTSKRWLEIWENRPSPQMVWIADHCERHDPSHNFTWRIETGILNFCKQILSELKSNKDKKVLYKKSLNWFEAERKIEKIFEKYFSSGAEKDNINDISLARKVSELIPPNHGFFIGNSLPVRVLDSFGSGKGSDIPTTLNRGASGIDGLIASACGYSSGLNRPVTLFIGDLSALHDLNSFKLIADSQNPILIILLNNHGGGIFSLLPISQKTEIFDHFFGAQHDYNFRNIAKMFDLNYFNPKSIVDFELKYKKAIIENKSSVIEIFTNRDEINKKLNDIHKKTKKIIV